MFGPSNRLREDLGAIKKSHSDTWKETAESGVGIKRENMRKE